MAAVVRVLPSGHEFIVAPNEPLLQAALSSGLALEFGCSNGSCGECQARVCAGEVRRIHPHDYVIRESDKRRGVVLLCCCTADGDLTIEASEARGPEDIPLQQVKARLYGQSRAGEGVQIVNLHVMRGRALRFLAGQHIRLSVPGTEPADISIASCPCDGLNVELHFGAGEAGALSALAQAGFRKSDRFEIEGPRGRFVLDEESRRPLLFIACDTAIAPVKSIIEHAINLELPQPVHLHWHATSVDGHYLHNYFRSLADALDEFHYLPLAGAVTADTLDAGPALGASDIYLAGREEFVTAAKALLLERGALEERLFIDALNRRPPRTPTAD